MLLTKFEIQFQSPTGTDSLILRKADDLFLVLHHIQITVATTQPSSIISCENELRYAILGTHGG